MVNAEIDRFQLRAVVDYKKGRGFPTGLNVSQKNKIRNLATKYHVDGNVIKRIDGLIDQNFTVNIIPKDSRSARVVWTCVQSVDYVNVAVKIKDTNEEPMTYQHPCDACTGIQDLHYLEGGKNYLISIKCVHNIQISPSERYDYIAAEIIKEYRSVLCIDELEELYRRAANFVKNDPQQTITVMYRNKPQQYWDNIMYNEGGIMMPYMKDFNGDPGSPINGQIKGLFFAGRRDVKSGNLPKLSPFGNWRFVLPTHRIFNPYLFNMYFADFYCHSTHHYVTVVLTRPGSPEDLFCLRYLKKLQTTNNPFFMYDSMVDRYFMSQKLYVEIFYTMPVDVKGELNANPRECQMGPTHILGRGSSKVMGIVKNPNCNICNLYQIKRKRDESLDHVNKKQKGEDGKSSLPEKVKAEQSKDKEIETAVGNSKETMTERPTLKAKRHGSTTACATISKNTENSVSQPDNIVEKSTEKLQEPGNIIEKRNETKKVLPTGNQKQNTETDIVESTKTYLDENLNQTCTIPIDMELSENEDSEILKETVPSEHGSCMTAKFSSDENTSETEAESQRLEEADKLNHTISSVDGEDIYVNMADYQVLDSLSDSDLSFVVPNMTNTDIINSPCGHDDNASADEKSSDVIYLGSDMATSEIKSNYPGSETGDSEITVKSFLWVEAVSVSSDIDDNNQEVKSNSNELSENEKQEKLNVSQDICDDDLSDVDSEVERTLLDLDSEGDDMLYEDLLDTSLLDDDMESSNVYQEKTNMDKQSGSDCCIVINAEEMRSTEGEKLVTNNKGKKVEIPREFSAEKVVSIVSSVSISETNENRIDLIKSSTKTFDGTISRQSVHESLLTDLQSIPKEDCDKRMNTVEKYATFQKQVTESIYFVQSKGDQMSKFDFRSCSTDKLPSTSCVSSEDDDFMFTVKQNYDPSRLFDPDRCNKSDTFQPMETDIRTGCDKDTIVLHDKQCDCVPEREQNKDEPCNAVWRDLSDEAIVQENRIGAPNFGQRDKFKVPATDQKKHQATSIVQSNPAVNQKNTAVSKTGQKYIPKCDIPALHQVNPQSPFMCSNNSSVGHRDQCNIPKVDQNKPVDFIAIDITEKSKAELTTGEENKNKSCNIGQKKLPEIPKVGMTGKLERLDNKVLSDLEDGELPQSPVVSRVSKIRKGSGKVNRNEKNEVSVIDSIFGKSHEKCELSRENNFRVGTSDLSEWKERKLVNSNSSSGDQTNENKSKVGFSSWLGEIIKKQSDKVNKDSKLHKTE